MSFDRAHPHQGSHGAGPSGSHAMPGKRTQVELLSDPSKGHGGISPGPEASASRTGGLGVPVHAPGIEAVRNDQAAIRIGEHGDSVKRIQNHLRISITGYFDKATQEAVIEFQNTHHLTPDGIVGVETIRVLIPQDNSGGVSPFGAPPTGGVSP